MWKEIFIHHINNFALIKHASLSKSMVFACAFTTNALKFEANASFKCNRRIKKFHFSVLNFMFQFTAKKIYPVFTLQTT